MIRRACSCSHYGESAILWTKIIPTNKVRRHTGSSRSRASPSRESVLQAPAADRRHVATREMNDELMMISLSEYPLVSFIRMGVLMDWIRRDGGLPNSYESRNEVIRVELIPNVQK